jgi:hypothetical protein
MLKYTATNLKKLETLFKEIGYHIIYEKGRFNSGYCMVNEKKIIVVNRFYKKDARINCLLGILQTIEFDQQILSEEGTAFYQRLNLGA